MRDVWPTPRNFHVKPSEVGWFQWTTLPEKKSPSPKSNTKLPFGFSPSVVANHCVKSVPSVRYFQTSSMPAGINFSLTTVIGSDSGDMFVFELGVNILLNRLRIQQDIHRVEVSSGTVAGKPSFRECQAYHRGLNQFHPWRWRS